MTLRALAAVAVLLLFGVAHPVSASPRQPSLAEIEQWISAHRYAAAESALATFPSPLDSTAVLSKDLAKIELLRLEARAFAPGSNDHSWLWRRELVTAAFHRRGSSDRARVWTARSLVESRFGLSNDAFRSARTAIALLEATGRRHPPLLLRARLAAAEAMMLNAADSAGAEVAHAEALIDFLSPEQRRLALPRLLRLRGEAVFWKSSLDSAARLLSEAHLLANRDLPPGDAERGRSLVFLGVAENQLLRNEAGNRHRREAVDILVRELGLTDERTCDAYSSYSLTQASPRDARAVIEVLETVRGTIRAAGFEDGIGMAVLKCSLARAHANLGRWDRARDLYNQSLATQVRWRGPWHGEVGHVHLEMAGTFVGSNPPFAMEHALAAQAIFDSIGHRSDTYRLILQTTIGTAFANLNQWTDSKRVLEPVLTEYLRLRGPDHWETGDVAVRLARVVWQLGDVRAADSLYALSTRMADFSDTSATAFVPTNLVRRSRFLLAQGQVDTLATLTIPRTRILGEVLEETLPWLLDEEGQRVIVPLRNLTDVLLSSLLDPRPLPPNYTEDVLELAIRGRAALLESWLARARDRATENRDSSDVGQRRTLLRRQLAAMVLAAYGQPSGANSRAKRDSLREEIRELEVSTISDATPATRPLTFAEFRASIPDNAVVISYFRCADQRGVTPAIRRPRELPQRLVAFVTRSTGASPAFFDLGPAVVVDSLATEYLGAATRGGNNDQAFRLGVLLRNRIWTPLESSLRGATRILIVTDGQLDRVPFHALPGPKGNYLVEESFVLHRLGHERDLLLAGAPPFKNAEALLVGDVDFNAESSMRVASGAGLRSAPSCASLQSRPFAGLNATRTEVEAIQAALSAVGGWSVLKLTGAAATEGALKQLARGPAVLHIATHGFFLDSTCAESSADSELLTANPLIFSGLVLAGANHAREAGAKGEEDGLLTAEELAGVDLRDTYWLVLSGCESGVGQYSSTNEGLYGLPRAARAAGARTTIMSMWPVDDEATAYWMSELYRARFGRGEDTALAVRSATRATLNRLRKRGIPAPPRSWGAFVAVGSWK